jgi:hypothetical protein
MLYLTFLSANLWFSQPEYKTDLCGLTSVICQDEDIAYIQEYIRERTGDIGLAIADCESDFRLDAVNYNRNKTWDKGLWQINDIHKLSDECRFDLECSTDWVVEKVKRDGGFGAWSCNNKI